VRCWKLVHPPPPSWLTAQTADQWSGPISLTAQPTANKLAETVNFAGASLKRVGHSYLPFTFLTFFYTWSLRSNFMCDYEDVLSIKILAGTFVPFRPGQMYHRVPYVPAGLGTFVHGPF
jgi:hypothetical protein